MARRSGSDLHQTARVTSTGAPQGCCCANPFVARQGRLLLPKKPPLSKAASSLFQASDWEGGAKYARLSDITKDAFVGVLSPEIRAKTLEAAKKALPEVKPTEDRKVIMASSVRTVNGDDDTDDYDDGGRSPNDDRSDSMNPNNDSYQALMDNRSDQMNPNNEAYWLSRGH